MPVVFAEEMEHLALVAMDYLMDLLTINVVFAEETDLLVSTHALDLQAAKIVLNSLSATGVVLVKKELACNPLLRHAMIPMDSLLTALLLLTRLSL